MSLLDDLKNAVLGGGASSSPLAQSVLSMLGSPGGGGLADLVKGFEANGLGNVISSWIGTGKNLPISPEQLQAVLGQGQLRQLAAQHGLSPDALSQTLSQLLPTLVDKLTPDGKMPSSALLAQAIGALKGKL